MLFARHLLFKIVKCHHIQSNTDNLVQLINKLLFLQILLIFIIIACRKMNFCCSYMIKYSSFFFNKAIFSYPKIFVCYLCPFLTFEQRTKENLKAWGQTVKCLFGVYPLQLGQNAKYSAHFLGRGHLSHRLLVSPNDTRSKGIILKGEMRLVFTRICSCLEVKVVI